MNKPVGFDQKIKIAHLDFIANELRYTEKQALYGRLDEQLKDDIRGDKSRKNAITMLMKIWCLVDPSYETLQSRAIEAFPRATASEKMLLHWGMTLLAYPFFMSVAEEMGHLFELQNEVPSQQVGRKIKLLYGDRRRVEVAIGAVLGSMKAWGVIECKQKKSYFLPAKISVENVALKQWILEVLLRISSYKVMPLPMLLSQNAFFPFDYKMTIGEIDTNGIKVDRQGLDTYMLSLG